MSIREKVRVIGSMHRSKGMAGWFNLLRTSATLLVEPRVVASRPLIVQIEPTINCNLKCTMCMSPLFKRQVRVLEPDKFEHILAQFPYAEKISLVGAGEPLLNPHLFHMIRYAKARGVRIGFATNATLLDAAMARKIRESGVDWLNISLDGATKQTYESIRIGADFERVLENIRNLTKTLEGCAAPEVSVWHVLMKSNIDELTPLVALVARLGIRMLYVQTAHCWGSETWKMRTAGQTLRNDRDAIQQALRSARLAAAKEHVGFAYVNIAAGTGRRACQWPWRSCYITTDGFVTPCCLQGANPDIINFGNIFTDRFENIWNGQKYRDFRAALKQGPIPSICVDCPSYYDKITV